jgi:hypothetical protein
LLGLIFFCGVAMTESKFDKPQEQPLFMAIRKHDPELMAATGNAQKSRPAFRVPKDPRRRRMNRRTVREVMAVVAMTLCNSALGEYVISTTPSPPQASQPFKVGVTGFWNANFVSPVVTVNANAITLALAADCGFLCPTAPVTTKTFDMPALPAGDYSLTVTTTGTSAADSGRLAFTVGAPAMPDLADYTDQWFNPAESGWGLGVHQQGSVIFATLFVYGSDGNTTWFVAPDVEHVAGSAGVDSFAGALYKTTGPVFTAAQFDSSAVRVTAVGTLAFNGQPDGTANVQYSVNSATVTKAIVRQSWRAVTGTATYTGGINVTNSSCAVNTPNGIGIFNVNVPINSTGTFTLSIGAGTLDLGYAFWEGTCRYTGTYTQAGRVGASTGTSACTNVIAQAVASGTMALSDIRVTGRGFSAHLSGNNAGCAFSGDIGGVRQQ